MHDIALFYQYDQQVPFSHNLSGKNDEDKEKMPDFFHEKIESGDYSTLLDSFFSRPLLITSGAPWALWGSS